MTLELDCHAWAEQNFGTCRLGDVRRNARAVKMAVQFAANPSGSTPEQTESWRDCKATYLLIGRPDVTFEALSEPHWRQTRARTTGHYLLLGDTTTISFDGERQIEGMGIINRGRSKGFLLHSSLMIDATTKAVVGLAGQTIHYRRAVPAGEKQRQRLERSRESEIWGKVIDQVGAAPESVRFTHVFDRGADNFEVYCHLLLTQNDWVVRAAQLKRLVSVEGKTMQLRKHLEALAPAGAYDLTVPANNNQPARVARMEVRYSVVTLPAPRDCGRFAKECGIRSITQWVVDVREVNPPPQVIPLRWVLLTSHAATMLEEALQVVEYYEQRPRIEEFHKALKTGCRLESRLYETAERWEAITAMLSIVAVRLLQLKTFAQTQPQLPADEVVPRKWIQMVSAVQTGKHRLIHTTREFFRALAGLGGHLGRKRDGEPGWITLWRGFNKLHLLLRGAQAMTAKRCG